MYPGRKGCPDRLCFYRGCFFVEFKSEKGDLSEQQKQEIRTMQNHGVDVYIVAGVKAVKPFVEAIKAFRDQLHVLEIVDKHEGVETDAEGNVVS